MGRFEEVEALGNLAKVKGKIFAFVSQHEETGSSDQKLHRFNAKPSEAIVCIEKRPVPKVTALGGVATGNIKAKEALIAAGIINNIGSNAAPLRRKQASAES